ncbi:DEAD/DEAH box helicase [Nocardia sp. NPDC004573]
MRADNLTIGEQLLVEVELAERRLPKWFRPPRPTCEEMQLTVVGGRPVVHYQDHPPVNITARGDVVELFTDPATAVVAWVAATRAPSTVALQCHVFQKIPLPGQLSIAIDDAVMEKARIAAKARSADFDAIARWFTDEFVLAPSGICDQPRIIYTGRPGDGPDPHATTAFRLHGRRWAADIALREDRLQVVRMTDSSRHADRLRPCLSTSTVRFVDRSSATVADEILRAALAGLGKDRKSYLELWHEYNEIERESLLVAARAMGWAAYHSCSIHADGQWRFDIATGSNGDKLLATLAATSSAVELEVAAELPPEFSGGRGRHSRGIPGELSTVNKVNRTLHMALDGDRDPSPSGYIYRSLTGDRVRLARRDDARERIQNGHAEMPGLRLLIEGIPLKRAATSSGRARQRIIDSALRATFGTAEPTATQIAALRMALETPDVLLVQGPPGTGKTQFITALLTCLDRLGDRAVTMNRTLLSSFQQNAVDNVSGRARHHGLPPTRVSPKGDANRENVREWRDETVAKVSAHLQVIRPEVGTRDVVTRVRRIVSAYRSSPTNDTDLRDMLSTLHQLTVDVLPPPLLGRLTKLESELSARTRQHTALIDHERLDALRVVRSIRATPVAFDDDGPARARFAQKCLSRMGLLDEDGRALLTQAGTASTAAPRLLSALSDLKLELFDRLRPRLTATDGLANRRSDVELLLEEISDAVAEAHADSGDGIDDVMRAYLDNLRQGIAPVEQTLSRYNSVLAATVQQTNSTEMSRILDAPLPVFDTVIVDEAARANPLDLMIPLACARGRIILVGDHKQLPHVLEQKVERELRRSRTRGDSDLSKSMFERWFDMFSSERPPVRTIRLDVQFRMHPELGRFMSETFYGGTKAVTSHSSTHSLTQELGDYAGKVAAWIDVPLSQGGERKSGTSRYRPVEAKRLAEELSVLAQRDADRNLTFGVITFYRAQKDQLEEELVELGLGVKNEQDEFQPIPAMAFTAGERPRPRLSVGTVDAFQGMEFDVVLLSVTRSSKPAQNPDDMATAVQRYGHLLSDSRMCVAMSRQRRLLVVVGDAAMARRGAMPDAIDSSRRAAAEGIVGFLELCQGAYGAGIRL